MNVEKMRHQLERNQDMYQLQWLTQQPQTAIRFPALQQLAAAVSAGQSRRPTPLS